MKKNRMVISVIFLILLIPKSVSAIYVSNIISFIKMASEISGQLDTLNLLLKSSKKLNEEFGYFKKRFMRIHRGLSLSELKSMLTFEDIEFYYNSAYVKINRNGIWFELWKKGSRARKYFKNIDKKPVLKSTALYKKSKEFRKRADYKIRGEKELVNSYLNALKMISDTKKIISERKNRYKKIEKLIKIANRQGAIGKLTAIQNDLKLENLVKTDMLITAMRIHLETLLKEKIIRIDNFKKSEIDRIRDRRKDMKVLEEAILKK